TRPAGAPPRATTAPTATTAATATTPAPPGAAIAAWPAGRQAWTVVLATTSGRAAADERARGLIAKGVKAGVLDTAKFNIDASGAAFVVFSGQFPSEDAAIAEETRLRDKAPASVFVAEVSPR